MKRMIFRLMALGIGLTAPIFAERIISEESYITGSREKNKKCERIKCVLCPTGPTGPAGATGSTGSTGPAGFLTVNYGSFYNESTQHVPVESEFDNVLFPHLMPGVAPVGVSNSATGTFTVDTSGIYTVSWILVVQNDSDISNTLLLSFAEDGTIFPPFQGSEIFGNFLATVSGSETFDLIAGDSYSLKVSSDFNSLDIDGASISIVQVAE